MKDVFSRNEGSAPLKKQAAVTPQRRDNPRVKGIGDARIFRHRQALLLGQFDLVVISTT